MPIFFLLFHLSQDLCSVVIFDHLRHELLPLPILLVFQLFGDLINFRILMVIPYLLQEFLTVGLLFVLYLLSQKGEFLILKLLKVFTIVLTVQLYVVGTRQLPFLLLPVLHPRFLLLLNLSQCPLVLRPKIPLLFFMLDFRVFAPASHRLQVVSGVSLLYLMQSLLLFLLSLQPHLTNDARTWSS